MREPQLQVVVEEVETMRSMEAQPRRKARKTLPDEPRGLLEVTVVRVRKTSSWYMGRAV